MCFKQAVGSDVNWVGHCRHTFYSLAEITAAGPCQRGGGNSTMGNKMASLGGERVCMYLERACHHGLPFEQSKP